MVFFSKGQFRFSFWEFPHRKYFLEFCCFLPTSSAFETKCVVPPRWSMCSKRSVAMSSKKPLITEPAILLLSSITSLVTLLSQENRSVRSIDSDGSTLIVIYWQLVQQPDARLQIVYHFISSATIKFLFFLFYSGNSFQMQRLFQKPLFTWKRNN